MTTPTASRLLRVVYFSRNAIRLPQDQALWEIDTILETSQANNARCGVTGALLFNNGSFVQVLEGPATSVEEVFERIQLDERHFDVTVIETGWVDDRLFPQWSMGFAGNDATAAALYADIAGRSSFDPDGLSANELFQLLDDVAKRNEITLRAA